MQDSTIKVRVIVEQNGIVLAEMVTEPSGGRHEFTFSNPLRVGNRHFDGFALEMALDREVRKVVYVEHLADRPAFLR